MTGLYDNVHEWVFTDWCHLTDGANYLMAKALVNEVKTRVFGLPLRPVDTIHNPADSYFTDYSKESTVSIDGKPSDPGQRILKGYPSKELFETRSDSAGVVLDFGSVKPISRMRIVWGDKSAVPEGWQVYVSEDGKAWKSWLDKDKTRTDPFDQWPGYEYYSPSESQARFVKYVEKNRNKTIRLRQLSLYR